MLKDIAARFIRDRGQKVEIRRNGVRIAETKCLPQDGEGYLSFLAGTDVRAGDEVYFLVSEKLYSVESVEKDVIEDTVTQLGGLGTGITPRAGPQNRT